MEHIDPGGAFGIATFCKRNDISRALFYKLDKQGKAPRTFKVGRRRLMTPAAEREWLASMEGTAA
jgi:predicted DNA-binding transcriptional regulator AlpA